MPRLSRQTDPRTIAGELSEAARAALLDLSRQLARYRLGADFGVQLPRHVLAQPHYKSLVFRQLVSWEPVKPGLRRVGITPLGRTVLSAL